MNANLVMRRLLFRGENMCAARYRAVRSYRPICVNGLCVTESRCTCIKKCHFLKKNILG